MCLLSSRNLDLRSFDVKWDVKSIYSCELVKLIEVEMR